VWCVPGTDDPVRDLDDTPRLAVLNTIFPPEAGRLTGLAPLKSFPLGLNLGLAALDALPPDGLPSPQTRMIASLSEYRIASTSFLASSPTLFLSSAPRMSSVADMNSCSEMFMPLCAAAMSRPE
jgi:hypothetical protein